MNTIVEIVEKGKYLSSKVVDELFEIEYSCKEDGFPHYSGRGLFNTDNNNARTVNFLLRELITNKILGFIILTDNRRWGWCLFNIAIMKEYRRKGYGSKLVKDVIEHACATIDDPERLYLHCSDRNILAQSLFIKSGFEIDNVVGQPRETLKNYYSKGEGALRMSMPIEPTGEML